jgi:hypothetical protein
MNYTTFNYTALAYSIYLPLVIALTIWVANKLLSNAKVFYMDIFHGQTEQAQSLNKLLQVGFYLIALGFGFLRLQIAPEYRGDGSGTLHYIGTAQEIIEALSVKVGGFVVILGIMLFLNLLLILTQRSKAKATQAISQNKGTVSPESTNPAGK